MHSHIRARASVILAGGAILVSACGAAPAATAPTAAVATAAPTVAATAAPTAAPATPAPGQVIAHKMGVVHTLMPKNITSVVEIDMGDHYFGNTQGQKNPTFTLPAGKIVGIHLHNEGTVLHEIVIGRTVKKDGDYEQTLTELITSDVFFYYGTARAEIGGATYGEIEVDKDMRDVWIRLNVPENLKGEWELGCFAPEHYDKGMHAKIIFQ
jgi:uncharacterized cupredoxin-like copper-binding protein